jgi:hypothetical protein
MGEAPTAVQPSGEIAGETWRLHAQNGSREQRLSIDQDSI